MCDRPSKKVITAILRSGRESSYLLRTKVDPACSPSIQLFNSYSWFLNFESNNEENPVTMIIDLESHWVAVTSMPESRGVLVCQLDCLASRAFCFISLYLMTGLTQ